MVQLCFSHAGMVAGHATLAVLVCSLALTSAHSAPTGALIKLLSSKPFHDLTQLSDLHLAVPPSVSMDTDEDPWPQTGLDRIEKLRGGSSRSRSPFDDDSMSTEVDSEDDVDMTSEVKRFNPNAFFGSRGKRRGMGLRGELLKRFQAGFLGSRGKRASAEEEEEWTIPEGKRFDPSGFSGSRGKRYIPGLEALLLSQVYRKLDAEKWKRQSLWGFHAARG